METTGYVLRLCPFESLAFSGVSVTEDDLEAFIIALENQTAILNATVCQREKFIKLIEAEKALELVEIPHWAGLGGVCFIPLELRQEVEEDVENPRIYSPEELQLINHRNLQLVNHLRALDSAFSLGEGGAGKITNSEPNIEEVNVSSFIGDGRMCIRFGMVSMETDVEELLGLVTRTGLELADQVNQLQSMSEMVRKGIEDAQNELRKESDEMIWQEGILRHVPLVGSIYNWLSPAQKVYIPI